MNLPVTRADIEAAHARAAPHVRRTPVIELARGALGLASPLSLKLEFLQHAGSFKARGAFNNLLSRPVPDAGVTAASGGNHGIAVAHAARSLGRRAVIFVPEISSPVKVAAIKERGAEVRVGGAAYADALEACQAYEAESGALPVHAYDSPWTLAGQGGVAKEWEEDADPFEVVLVASGGGGLVAGMAAWWHSDAGAPRVVAVEPEGSRALHAAMEAGRPVDVPVASVAADSLGARRAGDLVHAIAARAVAEVVLVPDAAIVEAQRLLWRELRIAAEPGGAASLAALLCGAYRPAEGARVGVLLCGGNVDPSGLTTAPVGT